MLKITLRFHHQQFAFFLGSQFNYLAGSSFRNVYVKYFDWLAFYSVDYLEDNLRLPNLQFIAFSPHGFYQDGQVKNTTAINQEFILTISALDSQGEVFLHFLEKPVSQMTGCYEFPLPTKEWRVVDGEQHVHGWLIDVNPFDGLRVLKVCQGITDFKILDPGLRTDFACWYF